MSSSKKILVVLTKQYPYGLGETYLNNELGVLSEQFDKVILAPTEAYEFTTPNAIIDRFPNVELFKLNEKRKTYSFGENVSKQLFCFWQWFREAMRGRESWNHLKGFRACMTYFKICYDQAYQLREYLNQKKWSNEHITLYAYWLHKASIVANVYKLRLDYRIVSVSRAHSYDLYHKDWNNILDLEKPAFLPFEDFKIRHSDLIFPISDHGRRHFEKHFLKWNHKFMVSRLGVVDRKHENTIANPALFRIVTCSGISPRKRLFTIPAILAHLKDLPVEWVHLGKGTDANMAILQKEIDRCGVSSMIQMTGHKTNDDIHVFYRTQQVNLILNLSSAEGIPVSLMEAICYGIPGIVTDIVGNPEVIDESCGYIVPLDFDPMEVSLIIRKMASDMELQKELRKGARRMYEDRYDAIKNYKQFAMNIKELSSTGEN